MIYKEENNTKIHRLRVIHIYESDLNFLLGLKWKEAMHQGIKSNLLHEGQYGSTPGKQSQTICLLEELRLDYSLLTRTPYTNLDTDLASCYDRVLLPISSLIARGMGIHRNITLVHANTLQEAEYRLKISTVTSETSYKHCTRFPIWGCGQGAANSPTIWAFISSKLFKIFDKQAYGMKFLSPNEDEPSVQINIVGFVDDTTTMIVFERSSCAAKWVNWIKLGQAIKSNLCCCAGAIKSDLCCALLAKNDALLHLWTCVSQKWRTSAIGQ